MLRLGNVQKVGYLNSDRTFEKSQKFFQSLKDSCLPSLLIVLIDINGKIERFNRTFKEMLTKALNNVPGDWYDRLGYVLQAHRSAVSDVTGYTPFFVLYGRHLHDGHNMASCKCPG